MWCPYLFDQFPAQNAVIPRLKAWIRKVVKEEDDTEKKEKLEPSAAEEAAEAAKAAASAAAVVARACQDLLSARSEGFPLPDS